MDNLFKYAPKELTQDGFLRWIFENYREPSLKSVARDLIIFLTADENGDNYVDISDERFVRLNSWSQVNHMDVGCDFYFEGDQDRCPSRYLVIEDKTTSGQHDDQLIRYGEIIEKWDKNAGQGERCRKVFYKTTPMDAAEVQAVKGANWRLIPLDKIAEFWSRYLKHENLIVRFYAEHIVGIYNASIMATMPKDDDPIAWESFFDKTVRPALEAAVPEASIKIGKSRYGYAYLNVFPAGCDQAKYPYYEIRGRDLVEDRFEARILKYEREIDLDSFARLREALISAKVSSSVLTGESSVNNKRRM